MIAEFSAALLLATSTAEPPAPTPATDASVLSPAALDQLRGGWMGAGGLTIGFGAVMRTLVDGKLAYETRVEWTAAGRQVMSSTALAGETGKAVEAAGGTFTTPDGLSTVLHRVGGDQLASIVVNSASGRSIVQNTDVTLTLPGFSIDQARMTQQALAADLSAAAANAVITAGRH